MDTQIIGPVIYVMRQRRLSSARFAMGDCRGDYMLGLDP